MTPLTQNLAQQLPLYEFRQFDEKLLSIAPKDVSEAFMVLGRYVQNAVFLPLLRSKNVEELNLQIDSLLPVYARWLRAVANLVFLIVQDRYRLLEKYAGEALDQVELFVGSEAEGKLSDTATLNTLAATSAIRLVSEALWRRVSEDVSSSAQIPIEELRRADEFSTKAYFYLNCVLHYLDGKVLSVEESVLEEVAYRARDNAQAWYATINEMGLIQTPDLNVPEEIAPDEEDTWLAEAGLEDYLNQLDK